MHAKHGIHALLREHFTRAHKTYRLTTNMTIGTGYHTDTEATPELQQYTVEAVTNLANASATYKGMIETLTITNKTLTAQLTALSGQVHHLTTNKAPTAAPHVHVPGPESWAQQGRGRGACRGQDMRP
jgi:hypothetical protein